MSVLDILVVLTSVAAAVWWVLARNRHPALLNVMSFTALGLAAITLIVEGQRWQLVPWELLSVGMAAAAGLRLWRPGHSHRWARVLGRIGLVLGILVGGIAALTEFLPTLPEPSGAHHVGSVIFRWTDSARPETFTANPTDHREVVVQAWYPTEVPGGQSVPYFEAQGQLPATVTGLPSWFFSRFGDVHTHATMSAPVSAERALWPVLVFSPGLGNPREFYTSLCEELASRGYVVMALSHPYESGVTVLTDGSVVGQTVTPPVTGPSHISALSALANVRAADSTFVLDQLGRLAQIEPNSPLTGHLDLQHVGMFGHSLGGATSATVLATDPRFLVGVDMDGKLFGSESSARLDQPFLWLQSDVAQEQEYVDGRDQLLGGLRGGGLLLTVGGSRHLSFSDVPGYFSPVGLRLLGNVAGYGTISVADMTPLTADLIAAFVGPYLGEPSQLTIDQALAAHPSVVVDRRIVATGTG